MDLVQLRILVHVIDTGSLSRASDRVNLTQPALSRRIRMLEDELGQPLLERTGRGMRPTPAGALLERHARTILEAVETARGELAGLGEQVAGTVSLALPPSAGAVLAGPLVAAFRAAHPLVRLRVSQSLSGEVREMLLSGRVDMGVLYAAPGNAAAEPGLRGERLWSESLWLVGPADAALTDDAPVALADALARPLILPGAAHGLRRIIETAAQRNDVALSVVVEADSLAVLTELVRRGLGFTLLPPHSFAAPLAAGAISAAPLTDPPLVRDARLAWARDHAITPAAAALATILRDIADAEMGGTADGSDT